MKKIILTLAAVSALTATAASAQPHRNDRDFGRPPITVPGVSVDARQAMIAQHVPIVRRDDDDRVIEHALLLEHLHDVAAD